MATIAAVITSIASAVSNFFKWRSSPVQQRRSAESDAKKAAAEKAGNNRTIENEVYSGDKDAVNARIGNVLKVMAVGATLALSASGCLTAPGSKPVYVPADRMCYPTTNSVGVAGWFVPNAAFSELLKSAQRASDLEIKLDAMSTFKTKE